MENKTVIVNKSQELTERRAQNLLATRTAIALLAAAHMRAMVMEGWSLKSDGHGGKILVAEETRLYVRQVTQLTQVAA